MSRARNRPKHALYGITSGTDSLITSFASGLGGLAKKPLEGAEREGALGFFKGLGKGVVGLATKPAIGVFDLASSTQPHLVTSSLSTNIRVVQMSQRVSVTRRLFLTRKDSTGFASHDTSARMVLLDRTHSAKRSANFG